MKRFHFRLETLLRLQRQRQRLAELAQAQAFRQWWESRQHILSLEGYTQAMSEQAWQRFCQPIAATGSGALEASATQVSVAAYWFVLSEHVTALQLVSELARAQELERRQLWEQRQQERLAATRKTEMLEILRHQALELFHRELNWYEQRRLDEAALRAWWYKDYVISGHHGAMGEPFAPSFASVNKNVEAHA